MLSVLFPVYQPIVRVDSRQISHIEALVRLRNDESGCAHRQLLAVAETCQFIGQVDMQMLRMVLADLHCHPFRVAVNLSPISIDCCAGEILDVLASTQQRQRILVEITESAAVKDPEDLKRFVRAAQKLGVAIAVDDYGNNEGCFTAELVRLLSPDFLKLDGTVLKRAAWLNNPSELYSALDLADDVGAEVIAEFVDSRQKQDLLKLVGIQYGQGLSYGAPVANANALAALTRPAGDFSYFPAPRYA